jgi:hypothetical protein
MGNAWFLAHRRTRAVSFNLDFRSPPCQFSRTRRDSVFPRPPFYVKLGPEEKQIENEAK